MCRSVCRSIFECVISLYPVQNIITNLRGRLKISLADLDFKDNYITIIMGL